MFKSVALVIVLGKHQVQGINKIAKPQTLINSHPRFTQQHSTEEKIISKNKIQYHKPRSCMLGTLLWWQKRQGIT